MRITTYLKRNYALFQKSLETRKLMVSVLADMFVIAMLFASFYVFINPILNIFQDINSVFLEASTRGAVPDVETMFMNIILLFIGFVVVLSVSYISSRFFIWRMLSNSRLASERLRNRFNKFAKHYFSTLLLFAGYMLIPGVIIYLSLNSVPNIAEYPERLMAISAFTTLILLFFIHLYTVFNYVFARSSRFFHSINSMISVGINNIQYFVLAYLIFSLLSWLLNLVYAPMNFILPGVVVLVATVLIYLVALGVLRLYLSRLIAVIYKRVYGK
ncbi:MAG: hypothetical protein ACLFNK_03035 [Candidatus Woesearchaeota archaeon]